MKGQSTMPNKDPALWAALMIWLHENWPSIYGLLLAVIVAWLRITYQGGDKRRRRIEALLCGAISLAFTNGMELFGIPREFSGFAGGVIGFIGVEAMRQWSMAKLKQDMKGKAE